MAEASSGHRDGLAMRKAAQADGFKTGAKHMKKVYIAHPLRGGTRDIQVVFENLAETEKLLQLLSAKHEHDDILFLSPLHAFSFVSPLGPQEWVLGQCRAMLDLCDELWVFGKWEASEGCRMEVEYAREAGIKVVYEIREGG